jgi:hypothetical protein
LADGKVDIFQNSGSADVIADVVAYYDATGSLFVPVPNTRVLDTRAGSTIGPLATFGAGATQNLQLTGLATIPAGATGVVLNVTGANASTRTNLRLFPADAPAVPEASNLNLRPGPALPNAVTVGLSPDGRVGIYNYAGTADVIIDVVGYFIPTA